MINNLGQEIHENNKEKGFYDNEKNIGEMLCLIHSEVSEALEADRKENYCADDITKYTDYFYPEDELFNKEFESDVKNTFEDELADVMIRVMDLAQHLGVDLEAHIKAKMRYNKLRPHKHGKKY